MTVQAQLARCDREIAEIIEDARQGRMHCWAAVMAIEDWEAEKRLIRARREARVRTWVFTILFLLLAWFGHDGVR
jgi:hypothetical protein